MASEILFQECLRCTCVVHFLVINFTVAGGHKHPHDGRGFSKHAVCFKSWFNTEYSEEKISFL